MSPTFSYDLTVSRRGDPVVIVVVIVLADSHRYVAVCEMPPDFDPIVKQARVNFRLTSGNTANRDCRRNLLCYALRDVTDIREIQRESVLPLGDNIDSVGYGNFSRPCYVD